MSDVVREKMFEARDLIQAKRYSEARSLLVTIDHPKAYEWLQKLDDVEARERSLGTQAVHQRQMAAETLETRSPYNQQRQAYAQQPVYDPIYDNPATSYGRDAAPLTAEPQQRTNVLHVLGAFIGGFVGALAGAAIWAAVAYFTEYEIGYVAIVVGLLAGVFAVLFSGGRRGIAIQFIAVVAALFGIVAGKYAAIYMLGIKFINEQVGRDFSPNILRDIPPFSTDMVNGIFEEMVAALAPVDALFVVLAVVAAVAIAARRKPRQPKLRTA